MDSRSLNKEGILSNRLKNPEDTKMHMSGESLLVVLVVGLIAGWLAGQIVQDTGFGIVGDLLIGIGGAFIGSWLSLSSACTSARALSWRSSTPPSARCYCCWSSGSFVAEAGGIEVGAEIGEEEVGEDVGSRRLAGAESRELFGRQTWKRRLAWPRRGPVVQLGPAISL
jgi:uncharacterized membrane protein YeaQ/YmgE (transglycosylase-associated protein family)